VYIVEAILPMISNFYSKHFLYEKADADLITGSNELLDAICDIMKEHTPNERKELIRLATCLQVMNKAAVVGNVYYKKVG
jgi:hypothetical protein